MKNQLSGHQIFDGRTLTIATMHGKEQVIAPLLEKEFHLKCETIPALNTDIFGMFSGEIERKKSPLETLRLKAMAALNLSHNTLAIASEGSFGPHPLSPFVSLNEEIVMLIDTKNSLEIVGRHLTLETNFHKNEIESLKDLEVFKSQVGYPEHGIVVKAKRISEKELIYKDFNDTEELDSIVKNSLDKGANISLETDMRAMHNPTRMRAIAQAVIDLAKNMKRTCPECNTPGFSICEVIRGLPCSLCNLPTKSVKAYTYVCKRCKYSHIKDKENVSKEDPTYCDFCNP